MWKAFTDNHEISTEGEIRNKRGMILKQHLHKARGYLQLVLTIDGFKKNAIYPHRLVATAFLPNPDNLPEVDHINRIRTDNRVENLRWVTHSGNCMNKDCRAESKSKEKNIYARTDGKFLVKVTRDKKRVFLGVHDTLEEAIVARDKAL
jgi:hypothetical protein